MKYIDIHCHLDFPDYEPDKEEVFARLREQEVGAITIGTQLEDSKKAVEIAEAHDNVWACIGVHPHETSDEVRVTSDEEWKKLVASPKVVGIGECGLDYFKLDDESKKEKQKDIFIEQIAFALEHDKPLMLHCRESYDDVLDILESYKKVEGDKLRGNSHFFAGNVEQAKRFLDIGFTVSFTGVITFTHDYDEVIKYLPQDMIMSETDAPFVAPVPYRGKRNEPVYVIEVVKKMAEIRGEEIEKLNNGIMENCKRVFRI
jgi:TatD DNase family protein